MSSMHSSRFGRPTTAPSTCSANEISRGTVALANRLSLRGPRLETPYDQGRITRWFGNGDLRRPWFKTIERADLAEDLIRRGLAIDVPIEGRNGLLQEFLLVCGDFRDARS